MLKSWRTPEVMSCYWLPILPSALRKTHTRTHTALDEVSGCPTPGQAVLQPEAQKKWNPPICLHEQKTFPHNPVGGRIKQKGRCKRAEEQEWGRESLYVWREREWVRERERGKAGWGYYRSFTWLWNPHRAWSSSLFLLECLPPPYKTHIHANVTLHSTAA